MTPEGKVWVCIPRHDNTAVTMMERWRENANSSLSLEEFTTRYRARFNCPPLLFEEVDVKKLAESKVVASCYFYPISDGLVGLPTDTPTTH